jgi:hypothetical protein
MASEYKTSLCVTELANPEKLVEERYRWRYGDDKDDKQESVHNEEQLQQPPKENIQEEQPEIQTYNPVKEDEPINTENKQEVDPYDTASEVDKKIMKRKLLYELALLHRQGCKMTFNWDMNSDYKMMKAERDMHKHYKNKTNSVKMMQETLYFLVKSLEDGNRYFEEPFNFKLDGWSDSVESDPNEAFDIFSDIYDRHGDIIGSNPWMRLAKLVGISGLRIAIANKTGGSLPDLKDQIQNNPALAQQLRQAGMSSRIAEQNSGNETVFKETDEVQYKTEVERSQQLAMQKQMQEYQKVRQDEEMMAQKQQVMKPPMRRRTPPQGNAPMMQQQMLPPHPIHQPEVGLPSIEEVMRTRQVDDAQYTRITTDDAKRQQEVMERMKEQEKIKEQQRQKIINIDLRDDNSSQHSNVRIKQDIGEMLNQVEEELSHASIKKKSKKPGRPRKQKETD